MAVAATAVAVTLSLPTPAYSVWAGTAWTKSATLGMAQLGHEFTPVGSGALDDMMSGTGGDKYTSAPVAAGGSVYVDLTNDSTVPVTLSGRVSATLDTDAMALPNLTVLGCDVAWDTEAGQCPTGAVTLAGPYPMNDAPIFVWGSLDPARTLHVAVATEATPATVTVEATATDRAVRAGTDRTGG